VTTAVGATRHRFALSVKSNTQFTATSAPSDFVTTAWKQWLQIGSTAFDARLDFMGVVTAPLSGAAAASLSGLIEKARANDAKLLPSRLGTPSWASADERALFETFSCPASLKQPTSCNASGSSSKRGALVKAPRAGGHRSVASKNASTARARRVISQRPMWRSHAAGARPIGNDY
jgi:hypothetical protein